MKLNKTPALALALTLLAGTATAQEVFAVRGFEVAGENPLDAGQTRALLAPFVRTDATLETLQQASTALERALHARGFGLYRVTLPPQEVGGTVRLEVLRFVIGTVDIQGATFSDEARTRASVPELQEGASPNFRRLSVQTAIANENPQRQLQVALRESSEPDKVDATVHVRESRPWALGLSASNEGTRATGHDRVTLFGSHANLFNRDQQFVGALTRSLERPGDVKQLGLSWRAPVYGQGGVLGASYTHSDVVGNFGAFSSTGAGRTAGLSYTVYVPAEGGRRSWFSLGLDDRVWRAALIDGMPVPDQLDRRSRPVSLGWAVRDEGDEQVWRVGLDFVFNTGAGAGNDLRAYQSEDPRIRTVQWKALRGSASMLRSLPEAWTLNLRGQFQYSPDALISGEQFGLGGSQSVRGTRQERPLAADRGASGSIEVNTPELAAGLRLLAFADGGWIGNHSPDGQLHPSSDIIASVGTGLRYVRESWAVSADYGRIVKGSRVPLTANRAAPRAGDDRVYLTVTLRF